MINDIFDKVVCINLKERKDKYTFIKERLDNLHIRYEFYHPVILNFSSKLLKNYDQGSTVKFNLHFPNELGTMISHYSVIKSALLDGHNSVFIFEDDCIFHKNWNTLLPKYLDTLPKDYDGVLLYSFMSQFTEKNIKVAPRWTVGDKSWSLLAYGLNRKAMEKYVEIIDNSPMIADSVTWQMMSNLGFKFYIASPPLVLPSSQFSSDIRGDNKNYEKIPNVFTFGINKNDYI